MIFFYFMFNAQLMHPLPCYRFFYHRLVQCLVDISTATLLLLLPPPQPRLFLLLPPPHATISPQQLTIISLVGCAIIISWQFARPVVKLSWAKEAFHLVFATVCFYNSSMLEEAYNGPCTHFICSWNLKTTASRSKSEACSNQEQIRSFLHWQRKYLFKNNKYPTTFRSVVFTRAVCTCSQQKSRCQVILGNIHSENQSIYRAIISSLSTRAHCGLQQATKDAME